MFGKKNDRIHNFETEVSGLKFDKKMLHLDLVAAQAQRDSVMDDLELERRAVDHFSRKLALAERAAKTVIDANEELVRLHAKDWLEIRELKADIAKQVREIERLKATHQDHEPVSTEEPQRGHGPEYLNLQRKVKRLRAKVKKLTSDNKTMAAEILHNRNSM